MKFREIMGWSDSHLANMGVNCTTFTRGVVDHVLWPVGTMSTISCHLNGFISIAWTFK